MKKILLTGASGFIGKNLLALLKDKYDFSSVSSKDYNLLDFNQTNKMFVDIKPEIVIHLASKTGGILANKLLPADFWFNNMMITTHVFELCKRHSVNKLIFFLPGCCYPEFIENPMKEEDIWNGFSDIYPSSGSLPKKMSIIASYAYRTQYGLNSNIIIPGNAYGKYDNFDENQSHVIPAMIKKMHKAKLNKEKELILWGNGDPVRDFIYVEDVINCIPYFIDNEIEFVSNNPCLKHVCNISSGQGVSIKELAQTMKETIQYEGDLIWDTTKPNGPMKKIFSNERMKSLELLPHIKTKLKDGLNQTYKWYIDNYKS